INFGVDNMNYNNETQTDIWVHNLAKDSNIQLFPQGSNITSIVRSLSTASKSGKGNIGRPDFTAVVESSSDTYLIVVESKKDLDKHVIYNETGLISEETSDVRNYAINGAYYYAKHLTNDENVPFKKIFALGISGNEEKHKISPIFVDNSPQYKELNNLETLINLSANN